MKCPRCSLDNLPNAVFCEECGTSLEKPYTPPPPPEERNAGKCEVASFLEKVNTRLRDMKTKRSKFLPRDTSKLIIEELSQVVFWYILRLMPRSPNRWVEFLRSPLGLVAMLAITYIWCMATDEKPPIKKFEQISDEDIPSSDEQDTAGDGESS
jgi:hypothetical protein